MREQALAVTPLEAREVLAELVRLVAGIEATAPELADRLELEHLLDRHVALALAHTRAVRAAVTRGASSSASGGSKPRHECQARVDQLTTELALLADPIRLIAQRAALPEEPILDDAVERHLAELDEEDAVREQLEDDLT